jgi:lysine-N-methylase
MHRFKTHLNPGSGRCKPPCNQELSLPSTPPIRPAYAQSFRCIGSACEDTCCQGWSVPVDQATYEKYRQLPPGPLASLINENLQAMPEGAKPASFAIIQTNAANQCSLLTSDQLCRIQAALGEGLLSHTCASYPRIVSTVDGEEETALALSCPEAARLILLDPELLAHSEQASAEQPVLDDSSPGLQRWLLPIRAQAVALIRNRAYPLWQRLFLLSLLCQRLDAIATGQSPRTIPDFLADFEATIKTGALQPAMETLPVDRAAQLDVVLRLAGMMLHRSNIRPRFVECIQKFTAGIGNGPSANLESLTGHYSQAYDRYYAPFFDRQPHILENYLANAIFRYRFPLGAEVQPPTSMVRECALLTAQFALMKGLLIGVAGFHREGFASTHVIHTMQAASKHFEHHPDFLNMAHVLLMESRMDGARGMAILLRNANPRTAHPTAAAVRAPGPQAKENLPMPLPLTDPPPAEPDALSKNALILGS